MDELDSNLAQSFLMKPFFNTWAQLDGNMKDVWFRFVDLILSVSSRTTLSETVVPINTSPTLDVMHDVIDDTIQPMIPIDAPPDGKNSADSSSSFVPGCMIVDDEEND
ncbi:hypothetical protein Ahy_B01g053334 [Arachis hypogaea]|uniref:Uncharacterized protein n=1 Tax=Arachis hypogaea TaxID=3818 RepID=A0A445ARI8_ARAHY|nr:hypothetical protein Ahy_B01g053334 [Arachis hypogaea]